LAVLHLVTAVSVLARVELLLMPMARLLPEAVGAQVAAAPALLLVLKWVRALVLVLASMPRLLLAAAAALVLWLQVQGCVVIQILARLRLLPAATTPHVLAVPLLQRQRQAVAAVLPREMVQVLPVTPRPWAAQLLAVLVWGQMPMQRLGLLVAAALVAAVRVLVWVQLLMHMQMLRLQLAVAAPQVQRVLVRLRVRVRAMMPIQMLGPAAAAAPMVAVRVLVWVWELTPMRKLVLAAALPAVPVVAALVPVWVAQVILAPFRSRVAATPFVQVAPLQFRSLEEQT
jgi:hypothetical protein